MTPTTFTTTSSTRLGSGVSARTAGADAAPTGIGATLGALATAASDGVSATLSLSENALKALAQVGESAVEGVFDGSTNLSTAARTVLGSAQALAAGVWSSASDAATGVAHLAESGWSDLNAGIASVEEAGGSLIDKIESGLGDVTSVSKTAATAAGHYAGIALDAASNLASGVTLGSVSLLAMI